METALRLAGAPYSVAEAVPPRAPKGKLPYLTDGAETIPDSRLILDYLRERYGMDLDEGLSPAQRGHSYALERMIEDDLFWPAEVCPRWNDPQNWPATRAAVFGGLPGPLPNLVGAWARGRFRKRMKAQGLLDHTEEQVHGVARRGLDALADTLGDKPYFLGGEPCTVDATAFAHLINILWVPVGSPAREHARSRANLEAFCVRMQERCFPEMPPGGEL